MLCLGVFLRWRLLLFAFVCSSLLPSLLSIPFDDDVRDEVLSLSITPTAGSWFLGVLSMSMLALVPGVRRTKIQEAATTRKRAFILYIEFRGANIGGGICFSEDITPRAHIFSGAFYVFLIGLEYQTKVSRLINWRLLSNIGDVGEYSHTYIPVV